MYICVCNAVTENDIRRAVAGGCHSLKKLKHELGVATECGRCAHHARHVLHESAHRHTPGGGSNRLSAST